MFVSLEYQDAKSHKFWKISAEGDSHTVSFGRVGSKGQSKTKSFADEAAATKDANKLIASKKKKGYVEIGDVPESTSEPLEAAVDVPAQKSLPSEEETQIERLREIFRTSALQDKDAFMEALLECGSLVDPSSLLFDLLELANQLLISAYTFGNFEEGKALVAAYAAAFPMDESSSQGRQVMASNALVLAVLSEDPAVESIVFEKLMPTTVTHAPLAFNLACFWAKKNVAEKVFEAAELALSLGKIPADFINDSDFADYIGDPRFKALLDANTPADLKAIVDALQAGEKFSAEIMNELVAQWFEASGEDDPLRRQAVEIIRKYGDKKSAELVKAKYDFDQEGKLFRHVCEATNTKTRIRVFKTLGSSIHINDSRVRQLPPELAAFANITSVSLFDAYLKEFPAVLLELPKLRDLNVYASKIEEVPPEIARLTAMRSMSFERNRLKTLPKEIGQLQELRSLDLSNNVLEDLPEELCELPLLESVDCTDNKALPGTHLTNMFHDFHALEMPVPRRKVFLNLILDKKARALEIGTRADFIAALNSRTALIRSNALVCLDRSADNAALSPSGIVLIGKFHGGLKAWKTRLKENGFKVVTKFANDVECVVFGEKPGDIDLKGYGGRVLAEPTLKRLLDALDTPYLQDTAQTSPEAVENLGELLASPDAANQLLALELMKTGGVPPAQLQDLLGVAYLSKDAKIRKQAMTLLKAHAPAPMQRKIAAKMSFRSVATEDKMSAYIESLAELDEIDGLTLARKALVATGRGVKYLFKHGDEAIEREVITGLIRGDSLELVYADLEEVPALIGEFTHLKTLRLHGNKLSELPETIWQLTNLESLDVSSNKLKEISEGVGKLTKLVALDIGDNKLKKLPAAISELTSLTRLLISGNKIKSFPTGLSRLKGVTNLDLGQMGLKDVPLEICEMEQLQTLYLGYNKLQALRPELSGLSNLLELNLGNCELDVLPESVTTLGNLQTLKLSFNNISEIPDSLASLANLKELHCRANKLQGFSAADLRALIPDCELP